MRGGVISVIYKKSLRLSNEERGMRATGDIVNLQSTDATRLGEFCNYAQVRQSVNIPLWQRTEQFNRSDGVDVSSLLWPSSPCTIS
jgi:hypothetical protein